MLLCSTLSGLVEFDGFYLESDPCLVCNNPEVPFSVGFTRLHQINSIVPKHWHHRCIFICPQEYQAVIYQSGHPLHHHPAGGQTHWQPHHQQSDSEDRRSETYQDGPHHQPVLQQQDGSSYRGAEEQVGFSYSVKWSKFQTQTLVLPPPPPPPRPARWHKAKKVQLTPGQTEVKIDLPLPIVASNLMIEFSDFYENYQASTETLQCPRCSASVPANPGVCGNCGENVYQCHKCR